MNTTPNPFDRIYCEMHIERLLVIDFAENHSPCYLPLHSSQTSLRDDEVRNLRCHYGDDFAFISAGLALPTGIDAVCHGIGTIREVVYQLTVGRGEHAIFFGHCASMEAALELADSVSIESEHNHRCWVINSAHLPGSAIQYLETCCNTHSLIDPLIEVFQLPASHAVGCKLSCTPWNDAHLQSVEGVGVQTLAERQRLAGIPEPLIELLHLAASVDLRILIFDSQAPAVDGLQTFR